jgi:hypothetical protein
MSSSRPSSYAPSSDGIERRTPAHQELVLIAERELLSALTAQTPPSLDLYVSPTHAESAAFDRAVHGICREAHRHQLRAEELLIAIKQAWFQLAAARKSHLGERDGDVLREVVSSSIEVFFESRSISDA